MTQRNDVRPCDQSGPDDTPPTPPRFRTGLPGLLALASAGALAVTTEMLPVGLLPTISASFGVSEARIGILVGLYAVLIAVGAIPLTVLTKRLPRKPLLLSTLSGYALSNVIVAASSSYGMLAGGRVLGGLTHALFFSLVIGYAPRLVAPQFIGRSLAVLTAGTSSGIVLGVPLFTSLGNLAGWRLPFAVMAGLSLATVLAMAAILPSVGNEHSARRTESGGRRALAAVGASTALIFLAQFTAYTYVSLIFLQSGVDSRYLGTVLLLCGACGLLGLWYVGAKLDHRPRRTAIIVLSTLILGLVAVAAGFPSLSPVLAAAAVWNVAFGGMPSVFQAAAVRTHAVSPELAGAWMNSTANVGISGGSALGAYVLSTTGLSAIPWISAGVGVLGLLVVCLCRNAFPSRH